MNLLFAGCATLEAENPLVERSKRYTPAWTKQIPGVLSQNSQSNGVYFLFVKNKQADLLQGLKQAEVEGRYCFFKMGAMTAVSMVDLYYEGKLDIVSRQKKYDIYILFAAPSLASK